MSYVKKIERNIKLLYFIKVAKWFMLYMPIVKLFLEENGLSNSDLFVLHASYSLAAAILEIPSGYLADIWGRKNALVAGSFLSALGFGLFSASHDFSGFFIAEIILGLGHSLTSGADSAMLYDSLLDLKKEKKYLKIEGRITATGNFSEAFAAIAAGPLAAISVRYPYFGQTIIAFIGFICTWFLISPHSHKAMVDKGWKQIFRIVRFSLIEHKALRNNIALSSVIGTATLTMAWFAQIYYTEINIPVAWLGVIWFVFNISPGLTSLFAHRIEHYLGKRNTILLIAISIPLGYLLLSTTLSFTGLFIIVAFYLIRGIATPILKDYVNKITSSEMRATVLSIRSLIIRTLFSVLGPILGHVTDKFSIQTALFWGGVFILINSVTVAVFFLKAEKNH